MPYVGWSSEVTPRELAKAIGITERKMRGWLRKQPLVHGRNDRWIFSPSEADALYSAYLDEQPKTR